MKTVHQMSGIVALIVLALALPASAKDQSTHNNKNGRAELVPAKFTTASRPTEAPKQQEVPAPTSTSDNDAKPNPDNMPYITYDGAENPAP